MDDRTRHLGAAVFDGLLATAGALIVIFIAQYYIGTIEPALLSILITFLVFAGSLLVFFALLRRRRLRRTEPNQAR